MTSEAQSWSFEQEALTSEHESCSLEQEISSFEPQASSAKLESLTAEVGICSFKPQDWRFEHLAGIALRQLLRKLRPHPCITYIEIASLVFLDRYTVQKQPPALSWLQPAWFDSPTMLKNSRQTKKLSPFFLVLFTFLLTLIFSLSWVSAKETPKPKPQPWQIDGIVAALDDSYPIVKQSALQKLQKLAEYQPQDLKPPVVKKPEDIAQKAANILKDEKVDASLRVGAAEALGNLGAAGAKYVPEILNFLKDEKVAAGVRGRAAVALGSIRKLELEEVVEALNNVYVPKQEQYEDWRF